MVDIFLKQTVRSGVVSVALKRRIHYKLSEQEAAPKPQTKFSVSVLLGKTDTCTVQCLTQSTFFHLFKRR